MGFNLRVALFAAGHAGDVGRGRCWGIHHIEREGKADGRGSDLLAVRSHGQSERVGREGDPVAGRMNGAAVGQHGGDAGLG